MRVPLLIESGYLMRGMVVCVAVAEGCEVAVAVFVGVSVGGTGVSVGGTGVSVGGTGVLVAVRGAGVSVAVGKGVLVGNGVGVLVAVGVTVGVGAGWLRARSMILAV